MYEREKSPAKAALSTAGVRSLRALNLSLGLLALSVLLLLLIQGAGTG